MDTVKIKLSESGNRIKPMHGVNCAPVLSYYGYEHMHFCTEAGFPFCRTHDVGGSFGGAHFIDVENIFTDMSKDENDPSAYDFRVTDKFIEEVVKSGMQPFYRLGATIENGAVAKHGMPAYHINPPADNMKYARICEHIVRHYNEGWADGYRYGIKYWEIWNEPENSDIIDENPCWKGTKEQFFELYRAISTHLRACFPDIKIGGYAGCGFYAILEGVRDPDEIKAAHVSPRFKSFVTFFEEFLAYVKKYGCPFDFYSWHSYAKLRDNTVFAEYVDKKLKEYGFDNVESILNEWNPNYRERGGICHAVMTAQMLVGMHYTPVSQMEFYTADFNSYGSLFINTLKEVKPTPTYYTFVAFNELYKLGDAVQAVSDTDGVIALGATDGKTKALMIVNSTDKAVSFDMTDFKTVTVTDSTRTYQKTDDAHTLPPMSIVLAK